MPKNKLTTCQQRTCQIDLYKATYEKAVTFYIPKNYNLYYI
jgi:hypothetical protein